MSWELIIKLLHRGESETVDFKKTLQDSMELARDLVAFSNGKGGHIVLGIDDKNGHLIGETVSKEWILSVAKTKCVPKIIPNVDIIEKAGKNIVLIGIHEGPAKPYYVEDLCYLRDGVFTRKATIEEERLLSSTSPMTGSSLNTRQEKALAYVQEQGAVTNKIYRQLYLVSHKTAHIELTDLVHQGLLASHGKGRSTCYMLPAIEPGDSF